MLLLQLELHEIFYQKLGENMQTCIGKIMEVVRIGGTGVEFSKVHSLILSLGPPEAILSR